MSHPHATSTRGRQFAAAALALLVLVTPLPAVIAGAFTSLPTTTPVAGSITAAIGAPADGAEFFRNDVIQFTDASTSDGCPITSWKWTFGDGTNSTLQNPTHSYTSLGDYAIALQVRSSSCTNVVSTATIEIHVVPIPPTVELSGPTTGVAGDLLSFTAAGVDSDGTVVNYAFTVDGVALPLQASGALDQTFTAAGDHTISVVAIDDEGGESPPASLTVSISPAALASITLDAPATVGVGSTHTLDPAGADAYGNVVTLAEETFEHTFQSTIGQETVCYTESNITACDTVDVIADEIATINVTGPMTLVVNTTGTYDIAAFDAFGNPAATDNATFDYTAPTLVGFYQACYTEDGVTGCADVQATPDVVANITVSGPSVVIVGSSTQYSVSGVDQYGNSVVLLTNEITYNAPTTPVELYDLCYEEAGIIGCLAIQVIPAPLDLILVTGVDEAHIGEWHTFNVTGFDTYFNEVELAVEDIDFYFAGQAGWIPVCYSEQGVQGCKDVFVWPDPFIAVFIDGPTVISVGEVIAYNYTTYDFYNNVNSTGQFLFQAPTVPGDVDVCLILQNVDNVSYIDCLDVMVVVGPLASIEVEGPDQLVVDTTGTFTVAGFDQYGNARALLVQEFEALAPEVVGTWQACYTEDGIVGCKDVEAVADVLYTIVVAGPASMPAGSTASFSLAGFDQFDNSVPLSNATTSFTAPTAIGAASVCYTEPELNVTGCTTVDVTTDVLATIIVSGPDSMVAGKKKTFSFQGFDQFGNAVDLDQIAVLHTAQTMIGTQDVCTTQQGVTGCKTIQVTPDVPTAITISGPASMRAGSTASFAVSGTDQYGNPGATSVTSFFWTAPSALGPAQACYTEAGATGCQAVTVIANPLANITVTGPAQVVAGATATFNAAGFDVNGNSTDVSFPTFQWTAPRAFGNTLVCYSENAVTGCMTVLVIPSRIAVSVSVGTINLGRTVQANAVGYDVNDVAVPGGTFTWSSTRGSITPAGVFTAATPGLASITAKIGATSGVKTLNVTSLLLVTLSMEPSFATGEEVTTNVHVAYVDGTPVAGAAVTARYTNAILASFVGQNAASTVVNTETDENGDATVTAPLLWSGPGDYRVEIRAELNGNSGVKVQEYSVL